MRDTVTEYTTETIFTWGAPPLKFGVGAVDELGHECARLDLARVLIVTDAGLARTGVPERVADSLQAVGIESTIFDGAHSEPTDASLRDAVEFAGGTDWDGFLAVGGGSAIDTRSEEHTSELQSRGHLVCRLLLEKKKNTTEQ